MTIIIVREYTCLTYTRIVFPRIPGGKSSTKKKCLLQRLNICEISDSSAPFECRYRYNIWYKSVVNEFKLFTPLKTLYCVFFRPILELNSLGP